MTAGGELARWCAGAAGLTELGEGLLGRVGGSIGFDGAFFAAVDPATLLYTRAFRHGMPAEASPAFLSAEFGDDDINQLRQLAQGPAHVGWLDQATAGERRRARRYREAMEPYGLGDELRVALMADGTCWGLLCLHRTSTGRGFTSGDAARIGAAATPIAKALRRALLMERAADDANPAGPGVLLLGHDDVLRSCTPAGARWLAELNDLDRPRTTHLPTVISAVVRRLKAGDPNTHDEASARTLAPSGRWLTVHASRLNDPDDSVAVVVEPTGPLALAPLIVAGFALTAREAEVTRRLLTGLPRKSIASDLAISLHTVNDHIKTIFDKTGASSAGELRSEIFRQNQAEPRRPPPPDQD